MRRVGLPDDQRCRRTLACGRRCLHRWVTGDRLCHVHKRRLWLLPDC